MMWWAVLLGLLIGVISLLYRKFKQRYQYWQSRGILCDEPTTWAGNLEGLKTKFSFKDIWEQYYNKYKGTGPFAGFYWSLSPAVFVLDKALVKNILIKDFNKFTDRGFFSNEKDDPLTGQLFLLDGHKWRHMRTKLTPVFTSGKMKFMFPTVVRVGEEFVRVFDETIVHDDVVDVKDILARFTTDVIGTCAFGIDCNSLKDPNAEFRVMGKESLNGRKHGKIGMLILSSFPDIARKLHMKTFTDEVIEFFLRIVRETVQFREQNGIRRNDFMDLLIDLKNKKDENGRNLNMEELAAQAFVFFLAGFETSSTTMGFALYELAQHEDIQQRAREEVLSVLKRHNNEYTYECIKDMQYLDQIISETLRFYTVVPILNRLCLEDYVVPGHPKYVIKKGMRIIIPVHAMHKDPDNYPDPEVFNPDNFTPEKVKERDSVDWLPFGEGQRNCIGMRFGQMQSRVGLALLLQNFKFSVCSKTQIPLQYDKKTFLLCSEGGIYLKVEKV